MCARGVSRRVFRSPHPPSLPPVSIFALHSPSCSLLFAFRLLLKASSQPRSRWIASATSRLIWYAISSFVCCVLTWDQHHLPTELMPGMFLSEESQPLTNPSDVRITIRPGPTFWTATPSFQELLSQSPKREVVGNLAELIELCEGLRRGDRFFGLAVICYAYGEEAVSPCKRCQQTKGVFGRCITLPDQLRGTCVNCILLPCPKCPASTPWVDLEGEEHREHRINHDGCIQGE